MAKKITKPTKPAKKVAKPAAKKVAPSKKVVPAKKPAKPLAKPVAKKPAKPVAKKVVKPVAKAPAKPVAKPVAKPIAKKVLKPAAKKPVNPIKSVQPIKKKEAKPVSKKIVKEVPKKIAKAAPKAAPKAAVKPEVKKNVKPVATVAKTVVKPAPAPVPAPVHVKPVAKNIAAKKITVEKGEKIISNTNTPFNDKPAEKEKPVFTSIVPKKTVIEDIGKTRYSDIELEEFRKLINEKLSSAKNELDNLKEALNNISGNSAADTESSYATFEDGSATQEKEHLSQMAARQRKFIGNLDAALGRIENKTYGICAVTGKLIPKERLRAVPHTTVSIEAKLGKV